ncbi:type I polyketide synthase [Streptomyces microflavus]|uniref:type I polyketide synthase n=1 Tax=Streptomyces microflavus TaxID=1919 RepID=UPI003811A568
MPDTQHNVSTEHEGQDDGVQHIAVVGLGCRVPGADSPQALWQLLREGRDEITGIPPDRSVFAAAVRAAGARAEGAQWGGFLPDIERWDPQFFGISPAEAARMDPQQALALEVAWRAFEDAGVVVGDQASSRTGVFIGQATHDYAMVLGHRPDTAVGPFTNPGISHAVTANRLSYLWDLRGPALTVDTACSSSLVAVHLAVQSLLAGECDTALAGGVNALLSPVPQLGAAGLTALAADGRCRTFDAAGKGYVRSEGAGAVVLRRLSDALAEGNAIHAVIRATGVNQDGRTNGLTAPSGRAQSELIESTLRRAQVTSADEVGYAELHGTGTPLGDPIEARALADGLTAALGTRARAPLAVGSIKANIGHLEGAAGILGLIKAALVLSHRAIPANPHFDTVNPLIDLDRLRLHVPAQEAPWPDTARLATVSSFGFGGTNAHAVLGRAPDRTPVREAEVETNGPVILPLSARDEQALTEIAHGWQDQVRSSTSWTEVRDLARAAAAHRTHFAWRAGLVAADQDELLDLLKKLASQDRTPTHSTPVAEARIGFVYSGHGSQWQGMGQELLRTSPAFEQQATVVDEELAPLLGWSPLAVLAGRHTADLDDISVTQPLIMTVQLAITATLAALGVHPAAVAGHSMGEVSAAVAARRLNLETACRVLTARNDAVTVARGTGGMAVVEAGAQEARTILEDMNSPVTVAADNSPRTCVLSGPNAELAQAVAEFDRLGRDARLVKVDYPSHGPMMHGPAEQLLQTLGTVDSHPHGTPGAADFYSTVTGQLFTNPLDADYWKANLTSPVQAQDAVTAMVDAGVTHLLEISPHPVLLTALRECIEGLGEAVPALATARRDQPTPHGLHPVVAELYEHGWRPQESGDTVTRALAGQLPVHPFRRRVVQEPAPATPAGRRHTDHWTPGSLVELGFQPGTFVADLDLSLLHDGAHHVAGEPAVSGAVLAALACWAAEEAGLGPAAWVRDLEMRKPLPADPHSPVQLVLHRAGEESQATSAFVSFLLHESGTWYSAASCTVGTSPVPYDPPAPDARAQTTVELAGPQAPGPHAAHGSSILDHALAVLAEALFALRTDGTRLDEFTVSRIDALHIAPGLWLADRATAHGWLRDADGHLIADMLLTGAVGQTLAHAEGIRLRHLAAGETRTDSPHDAPTAPPTEAAPLQARLDAADSDEDRLALLRDRLRDFLGAILPDELPAQDFDELPFAQLGLESLMGVELRNRLEKELGRRLSVTLLWRHPTVNALAAALAQMTLGQAPTGLRTDTGEQAAPIATPSADPLTQLLAELDHTPGDRS